MTRGRPGGGEAGLLARTLPDMAAGWGKVFGQYRTVQNYENGVERGQMGVEPGGHTSPRVSN